jgi:hypothetical protein
VTSYWTPEFDPEFSAFGPYLHHRWSLTCQSFDAIDQGSLSPTLALSVLSDFLAAETEARNGVLLGIEQSTTPQAIGANLPVPRDSSAGVIRLSRSPEGARAEILASAWFAEQQVLESRFQLEQAIAPWSAEFGIEPHELTIVVRRDTFIYRSLQYWRDRDRTPDWRFQYLAPTPSCMHVFAFLSGLVAKEPEAGRSYVFLDEDVESLAAAAILVRSV